MPSPARSTRGHAHRPPDSADRGRRRGGDTIEKYIPGVNSGQQKPGGKTSNGIKRKSSRAHGRSDVDDLCEEEAEEEDACLSTVGQSGAAKRLVPPLRLFGTQRFGRSSAKQKESANRDEPLEREVVESGPLLHDEITTESTTTTPPRDQIILTTTTLIICINLCDTTIILIIIILIIMAAAAT